MLVLYNIQEDDFLKKKKRLLGLKVLILYEPYNIFFKKVKQINCLKWFKCVNIFGILKLFFFFSSFFGGGGVHFRQQQSKAANK